MSAVVIVLSIVVAALCVLVAGLLRAYAEVLRKLHDLGAGGGAVPFRTIDEVPGPALHNVERRSEWTEAHDLSGQTPDGAIAAIPVSGVGHDTLVAFLSSGCTGCAGFWDDLGNPQGVPVPPNTRLVVVTKSPEDESMSALQPLLPQGVDVVMSSELWEQYEVPGSPYVVVIDGPTGRMKGEGSGSSFQQLSSLVRQAVGDAGGPLNRKPMSDAEREAEVDRMLLQSGIGPGHPSLYRGGEG